MSEGRTYKVPESPKGRNTIGQNVQKSEKSMDNKFGSRKERSA